jgi:hypothetical protein
MDTVTEGRIEKRIDDFRVDVGNRFAAMGRRFDAMGHRIDDLRSDMDGRFDDLRSDMDGRFDDLRSDMDGRFDDLRTEMGHRFDAADQRAQRTERELANLRFDTKAGFERMYRLLFGAAAAVTTTLLGILATQL